MNWTRIVIDFVVLNVVSLLLFKSVASCLPVGTVNRSYSVLLAEFIRDHAPVQSPCPTDRFIVMTSSQYPSQSRCFIIGESI